VNPWATTAATIPALLLRWMQCDNWVAVWVVEAAKKDWGWGMSTAMVEVVMQAVLICPMCWRGNGRNDVNVVEEVGEGEEVEEVGEGEEVEEEEAHESFEKLKKSKKAP
jgi:hypothetical protein